MAVDAAGPFLPAGVPACGPHHLNSMSRQSTPLTTEAMTRGEDHSFDGDVCGMNL
jgi:hypothetical protein